MTISGRRRDHFIAESAREPFEVSAMTVAPRERLDELLDEPARVHAWRWHLFDEMGFSYTAASTLARSRADTHAVQQSLERGCSKNLVLRIFT